MLSQSETRDRPAGTGAAIAQAVFAGYFIVDRLGHPVRWGGDLSEQVRIPSSLVDSLPMLVHHLNNPSASGAFYKIDGTGFFKAGSESSQAVFVGPISGTDETIAAIYNLPYSDLDVESIKSEMFILSLITQAVRAFNRAENLDDILRMVLIGVTAGSGLGFNRAFVFLTCDEQCCLKGALANGPSSPEEASIIWQKLARGELTLEELLNDALKRNNDENRPLNAVINDLCIPLDQKDNIFVRAALEKKSMIIDEAMLSTIGSADLQAKMGPGPLAVVPLVGKEYLQGVLIADNFITRKPINENDVHLLEIFARYASDSIEKFRLYKRLEKKIEALKKANEIVLMNRQSLIKAERLAVLAEMAGQVSHEIRNPLTIIGGFAKSMLKKMAPEHENYEYLNIIFNQVVRIGQSLEKFTSLMNYQAKNDQVYPLEDLVQSALAIRPSSSNPINIEVNGQSDVKIKIDPDLFRQALLIILKQASMLGQARGAIILEIKKTNDKAYVFFQQANLNGEFAASLYKSFQSGGNHETLRELSTSLEILKYYGGNIGLSANAGEPNKFYLELPVHKED